MSDKALAVLESRLRRGLWIEREGKKTAVTIVALRKLQL
jgi:hypothetical protein